MATRSRLKGFIKPVARFQTISRTLKSNRSFIVFIVFYCVFRTAYADWSPVPSGSMEPTIQPGDYLLIDKTTYGPTLPFFNKQIVTWGKPARGDIITFVPPHTDKLYVKRVIGIPGDNLRIDGVRVYINGTLLEQRLVDFTEEAFIGREVIGQTDHLFKLSKALGKPRSGMDLIVPEGKYFVMGDHRNNSADSRYWGFVEEDKIMGKVERIVVSFSWEWKPVSRIGLSIN